MPTIRYNYCMQRIFTCGLHMEVRIKEKTPFVKLGFTVAEVLITIGVIGVMPR